MILSVDTGFIEKVHLLHRSCKNAKDLATAMNYSQSGFTAKFKTVFGKSVYQWMKEQKTRGIYHEICTTNKNFSQIAEEFGFKNYNHFIEYCTINIGNPPGKLRKDPIRNRNAEKSGQNSE